MRTGIQDKNVVLGVCGGIAAYKSVELLRLLVKHGARVRTVMTRNAREFVGPVTFEALSKQAVCADLFERGTDASIRHIEWAQEADAVVIAPATANIIGKLANGLADDALSTLMTAVTCPVVICPSMNTHMYENKAVQRNIKRLKDDGYFVLEPEAGELACGTSGPGRLPEPEDILDRLRYRLAPKDFQDKRVLVTAGPTQEPIDPVRFISNPSSGKMGYAVARAAEHRGGRVVLITGPTHLPDPNNVSVVKVRTAQEMAHKVFEHMPDVEVVVKTAAVSDFRPKDQADHKLKKDTEETVLVLQKNQDILQELGRRKKGQILVGFAAETQNIEQYAAKKLAEKNLDMIAANLVGQTASGFASDTNEMILFFKDGTKEALPVMPKEEVAHILLDRILKLTTP